MKHNISAIKKMLAGSRKFADSEMYYFEQVNSTNTWLLEQDDIDGKICLAEQQLEGRGRRGKNWIAEESGSVLLSFGYGLDGSRASGLSLLSGLCVVRSLESCGVSDLALKWPNDVLLLGKKLGGILIEVSGDSIIFGIGINLSLSNYSGQSIAQPWTDLISNGYDLDKDRLVATLLIEHENALRQFAEDGFSVFADQWNSYHAFAGQLVDVTENSKTVRGTALGVTASGELKVMLDKSVVFIHSGEVLPAVSPENRIQS